MPKVVYTLGDDVSTDAIYPGRFMATVLPTETLKFAFADDADFNGKLQKNAIAAGSVIAAGENFGCGSSREQAASCLKGHRLTIVARGFARIFLQNSVNLGLTTVTAPDFSADVGDELEITPNKIVNRSSGKEFEVIPLPPARQSLIDAGGLIAYTRKRLLDKVGTK